MIDPATIPQNYPPRDETAAIRKPQAIDLYCGLGGWTEGLLAEGYECIGYDIEAHEYGEEKYPGTLILADVKELDGAQFADADLIVASPPCQEYSYMAMPWGRAKQIARALRGEDVFPEGYTGSRTIEELNALFNACYRIQKEACAAAGRYIPLIIENVRGAIPWVGRSRWNFGSYHLWGDVPALMPATMRLEATKAPGMDWSDQSNPNNRRSFTENGGRKNPGFRFDGSGKSFQSESVNRHVEGQKGYVPEGTKARKAASAKIAKIPFALSSWIAKTYYPETAAIRQSLPGGAR